MNESGIYLSIYLYNIIEIRISLSLSLSLSVQFSPNGIYALGKAHMRSTPSLRSFPNVPFETVQMFVWLTMNCIHLQRSWRQRRWPSLVLSRKRLSSSSFHASLLQAIDGVMSLALYPQVFSQVPQNFRSSKKQDTREGCFARQSICSVISLHSGMSRAVHPQEFSKVDVDHWHIRLSSICMQTDFKGYRLTTSYKCTPCTESIETPQRERYSLMQTDRVLSLYTRDFILSLKKQFKNPTKARWCTW